MVSVCTLYLCMSMWFPPICIAAIQYCQQVLSPLAVLGPAVMYRPDGFCGRPAAVKYSVGHLPFAEVCY